MGSITNKHRVVPEKPIQFCMSEVSIKWHHMSYDYIILPYYHSVPGKHPLPGKRPDTCFGCTNGERPLPGERPGSTLTVIYGKCPGSFSTPARQRALASRYVSLNAATQRRGSSIMYRLYPQQPAKLWQKSNKFSVRSFLCLTKEQLP